MAGTERPTCANCAELRAEQVGMLRDRLALKRRIADLEHENAELKRLVRRLRPWWAGRKAALS